MMPPSFKSVRRSVVFVESTICDPVRRDLIVNEEYCALVARFASS
jgi:hypothetical protein